ncbi:MAG TPA: helix-turn-helix domain-containing protein [Candidatus Sulfotelmatobacter sp.]
MNAQHDAAVSSIAAAIGEPARARMLYCLMDGHARTSTELSVVAGISPSTASVHLHRLKTNRLVKVFLQGKHRFYNLDNSQVAEALEGLSVLAGEAPNQFQPSTPSLLRTARTCYDHIAGALGVALHDRFHELKWVSTIRGDKSVNYGLTREGVKMMNAVGIDAGVIRLSRRKFAFACLDWSERRPHIGGALGAALLQMALRRKWVLQELDSRALSITSLGRREMKNRFGVAV